MPRSPTIPVPDDNELMTLASQAGGELLRTGHLAVTAESCTGGLVAKLITDLPGSSRYFEGAFVTYSNHLKETLLGVSPRILSSAGAVSAKCVEAMAVGALVRSMSHIACAISGIAGPDGGAVNKPVGTVWIAFAHRVSTEAPAAVSSHQYLLEGDRDSVRRLAAMHALRGIIDYSKLYPSTRK